MDLAGRTALVTGGAVRVGRALCQALADRGCGVVIHCDRSLGPARELAACLRRQGVGAWVVCVHLSGDTSCRRVIRRAAALAGRLDILINNAAVFHRHGLREADAATWRAELDTNLVAPALLTRHFAGAPGAAAIVNILDRRVAGLDVGAVPYSVSKKALEDVTRLSALALAPAIRVNAVAPGPVLPREPGSLRAAREAAGRAPLARRPTPEDVADAVLFLLGNDAVTGQTLFVDGGQHLGEAHA
jgi:NAD(P)-dependent dehydrogenase (short-subunit alcohol dehydrogenase family)